MKEFGDNVAVVKIQNDETQIAYDKGFKYELQTEEVDGIEQPKLNPSGLSSGRWQPFSFYIKKEYKDKLLQEKNVKILTDKKEIYEIKYNDVKFESNNDNFVRATIDIDKLYFKKS